VLNHAYESPRIVDAGEAAIRSGIARGVAITAAGAGARLPVAPFAGSSEWEAAKASLRGAMPASLSDLA
jgi:hypothetical protein